MCPCLFTSTDTALFLYFEPPHVWIRAASLKVFALSLHPLSPVEYDLKMISGIDFIMTILLKNLLFLLVTNLIILTLKACHHLFFPAFLSLHLGSSCFPSTSGTEGKEQRYHLVPIVENIYSWELTPNCVIYSSLLALVMEWKIISYQRIVRHQQSR